MKSFEQDVAFEVPRVRISLRAPKQILLLYAVKTLTYSSKLSFVTVTSITGDPNPFHDF